MFMFMLHSVENSKEFTNLHVGVNYKLIKRQKRWRQSCTDHVFYGNPQFLKFESCNNSHPCLRSQFVLYHYLPTSNSYSVFCKISFSFHSLSLLWALVWYLFYTRRRARKSSSCKAIINIKPWEHSRVQTLSFSRYEDFSLLVQHLQKKVFRCA